MDEVLPAFGGLEEGGPLSRVWGPHGPPPGGPLRPRLKRAAPAAALHLSLRKLAEDKPTHHLRGLLSQQQQQHAAAAAAAAAVAVVLLLLLFFAAFTSSSREAPLGRVSASGRLSPVSSAASSRPQQQSQQQQQQQQQQRVVG
ncbi:hypothetical protein Emag_002328 [Eimeria magna]